MTRSVLLMPQEQQRTIASQGQQQQFHNQHQRMSHSSGTVSQGQHQRMSHSSGTVSQTQQQQQFHGQNHRVSHSSSTMSQAQHNRVSHSSSTVAPAELPAAASSPSPSHSPGQISLQLSSPDKNPSKPRKFFRRVRSAFKSLPILSTPAGCKMPMNIMSLSHTGHNHGSVDNQTHIQGGTRMTGTLFGYRKARINLAIQENPRCVPVLLLELAVPTSRLLQEMGSGLVRIALECEKRHPSDKTVKSIIDEPLWTMYLNGKKTGYGVKRDPTPEDLHTMQMLHAVSMGAGVLPAFPGGGGGGGSGDQNQSPEGTGELTYMRANFERVTGSRDSETFYMMNPDGNSGPELSIFFVRI